MVFTRVTWTETHGEDQVIRYWLTSDGSFTSSTVYGKMGFPVTRGHVYSMAGKKFSVSADGRISIQSLSTVCVRVH